MIRQITTEPNKDDPNLKLELHLQFSHQIIAVINQ